MRLTAVCCGRNDNYGGHFLESAQYSLNSFLQSFDEVIYVDWNTDDDKPVVTDAIELKNRDKLRTIEIRPAMVKKIMGDKPAQLMCEVMARNVGIRRATGDIIVDTNCDVIAPPREQLELAFKDLKDDMMITIAKQDVELGDIQKNFGTDNVSKIQNLMPVVFGLWPIHKRLMSPFLRVTKDILERYPVEAHQSIASVICACGDFQAATRATWHNIRGFEESQCKRMFIDTQVQYKVIMGGGVVIATNFPPVYHIEHGRDNSPSVRNSEDLVAKTTNTDDWGLSKVFKEDGFVYNK